MNDDKNIFIEVYERYGFTRQKEYPEHGIIVFLLKAGYFNNVDIVPVRDNANTQIAFEEFTQLGYACSIRKYEKPETVERLLFEGFFSIDSNQDRLRQDYKRFTDAIVKPFGEQASYEYLNAPYTIDGVSGTRDLTYEILTRININRPVLFLVEAAAGFGKTCSAYELVSKINEMEEKIPLFAELSRNRQARIFKHILLDEIDRTFPLLSSKLVQHEILKGRVITILDGFDELLRNGDSENEFDNREPMLETIGEYLRGAAKIILTTRRTVLFEDDDFHKWVEKNGTEFSLVKIKIGEPLVNNWLDAHRLERLKNSTIDINNIANPVLLSYLRCIHVDRFNEICENTEKLVESYFEFMLEREMTRQELILDIKGQTKVLSGIAQDMIDYQYKSEDRDYIVSLILDKNVELIERAISSYPANSRPTKEELANKLASHALLDRSVRYPNKIGFVNEFVLGNYVAKNVIRSVSWENDDWNFLEPAILSFRPRSVESRDVLWQKLQFSLEFLDFTKRVSTSLILRKSICMELFEGEVDGLLISDVIVGEFPIKYFQFNDCAFTRCRFDLSKFEEVTFLNCRFYDCQISNDTPGGDVHLLGVQGDLLFLEDFRKATNYELNVEDLDVLEFNEAERAVLEKFWPVGRETITFKHRPIKGVCIRSGSCTPEAMYRAVASLKRKKLLLEPRSSSFVEINFEKINEIRSALGR